MTKFTIACLLLFTALQNTSFCQTLSNDSKKVLAAYEVLEKHPNLKRAQLSYLQAFPGNKSRFLAVFDPENFGQLYSRSDKFIAAFAGLASTFPAEVINKSINIGKDLIWQADATGYLQHAIVQMGNEHTNIFATKLNALPAPQQNNLVKLLADVENHRAYHEYQALIDALNKTHQPKLATLFVNARTEREKRKHD
jgi:hypothetical protein